MIDEVAVFYIARHDDVYLLFLISMTGIGTFEIYTFSNVRKAAQT